ncbi:MAG: dihydroneopterin aldolase [Fibrobacterota bacterium]|nr:dihydroneopterin aldolase [Fibrobacterota bacterium]
MGILNVDDLRIRCIVGVYTHERKVEQDLFVDVRLEFDFSEAARTDQISHSLDYTRLAAILEEWMQREKFQLIETLAERACVLITDAFPEVRHCRVTIKKPAALAAARYASVTAERSVAP